MLRCHLRIRAIYFKTMNQEQDLLIDTYTKMLFFSIIGIKGVFSYYYSKSNEFKGNYPDTIEEFIDRCMKDPKFCRKWFSMCYDELKYN